MPKNPHNGLNEEHVNGHIQKARLEAAAIIAEAEKLPKDSEESNELFRKAYRLMQEARKH